MYRLIKAAELLHTPPWELATMPAAWAEWALTVRAAEDGAREALAKRAERDASRRGAGRGR